MLQGKAARKHAPPIVVPTAGGPLIKSTVSLGRRLEWRTGRSVVDADMPDELRKRHVYNDFQIFRSWMEKEDGAHYRGQVRIHGPFPHFEAQQPDIQVGDRGGKRPVARNVQNDVSDNGKEDYVIEALFDVPEYITEIPTEIAVDIFGKGTNQLRPLRGRDWNKAGNKWSQRN